MPPKTNPRNWNDVQTAIATVSIVTTLGLWNLFATPVKTVLAQADEPALPPTEPPMEVEEEAAPTEIPQVKIMFTPNAPQITVVQQTQAQTQTEKKKKKNKNNGGTVTQTKTS